jgi:hypothetical protein
MQELGSCSIDKTKFTELVSELRTVCDDDDFVCTLMVPKIIDSVLFKKLSSKKFINLLKWLPDPIKGKLINKLIPDISFSSFFVELSNVKAFVNYLRESKIPNGEDYILCFVKHMQELKCFYKKDIEKYIKQLQREINPFRGASGAAKYTLAQKT